MIFFHLVQFKFDLRPKKRDFVNPLLKSFIQRDKRVTRN